MINNGQHYHDAYGYCPKGAYVESLGYTVPMHLEVDQYLKLNSRERQQRSDDWIRFYEILNLCPFYKDLEKLEQELISGGVTPWECYQQVLKLFARSVLTPKNFML